MNPSPDPPDGLEVGVIGVGHLGTYHLQKYAAHPDVARIHLHDSLQGQAALRAEGIASAHEIVVHEDLDAFLAAAGAVTVAVPTTRHADVVERCLDAGCDVLVEKPIASDSQEASRMVAAAEAAGRILHVGHVERFNPALQGLEAEGIVPGFIEAHRLAPYNPRGTDVPVVLDLMVHDLDLILHLVGESPSDVQASGVPVITDSADIANVRLTFPGGCVANVTASRVSLSGMRKLRIFQRNAYISLDLQKGRREVVRLRAEGEQQEPGEVPVLPVDGRSVTRHVVHGEGDALALEVDAFLRACRARRGGTVPDPPHGVSGREAAAALALAEQITQRIERS